MPGEASHGERAVERRDPCGRGRVCSGRDVHSYSDPDSARVRHVDLDLEVLFPERVLKGAVVLRVERAAGSTAPLVLDTRDLSIERAESSADGAAWSPAPFQLGAADKIRGAPLTITLPAAATQVRVAYRTSPSATRAPVARAVRRRPARSSRSSSRSRRRSTPAAGSRCRTRPGVRVTYTARIRTSPELVAVMSARNDPQGRARDGEYRFEMPQPIPSYLIALAVGDLAFAADRAPHRRLCGAVGP